MPRSRPAVPAWRLAALAVLSLPAAAPAFEGRLVPGDSQLPVGGAEVAVLGHNVTARADADGHFAIEPDPLPPFELLVVLPGERYLRPIRIERLPESGPLEVRLTALLSESVTVTAGVAPDLDTAPAAATTLLPRADLEVRQPATLTQALENVPGLGQVSEGQAAVPALRGLARGRTLLLIDGARVSSERRVGPSATFLDPFSVDAIEVARGPGSVAYGSDALGGVIQARTRRPVPNGPLELRMEASGGVGTPQARVGLEASRGFAAGGLLFQAHGRTIDNYRSPNGEVINSSADDRGLLVRGEQTVGGGLLSLGWQSDQGRDIGRPRTNSARTRIYYPEEDSHRLTASWERGAVGGLNRLSLSTFLGGYGLATHQDTAATPGVPRSIARADVEARDYHLRATAQKLAGKARVDLGAELSGRFGLEAIDQTIEYGADGRPAASESSYSIEDARRDDLGFFLAAEAAPHARLSLSAGGRVDRVTTRNRGGYFGDHSTGHAAFSGFASLSLDGASGLGLTAQVTRGFRDPVLSDRYYRGVTGRGFITGNPELEPETSLQWDLALRYTHERLRAAVYAYRYDLTDLVERYETEPDFFYFRNRGEARLTGVELEAQAALPGSLSLALAAHLQRGRSPADDVPLDDIAPPTLSVQLRRPFGPRVLAELRAAAYGDGDDPGPTEVATPAYWLLDAALGWELGERLRLNLSGRNLLDRRYPAAPDSRAVLAPGASGLVTLTLRLPLAPAPRP